MNEDAVDPQVEPIEQIMEEAPASPDTQEDASNEEHKTMVPLSALQKLREKKKELELQLQWERQRNAEKHQEPPQEDNSRYESATKEDLRSSQEEAVRLIEEKMWIKQNPEKYEKVNEYLPTFLKQRPNLASAINLASNRYEEAYTLMEALTPKQQQQLKKETAPKKEAPNSPTGVPKAAAMNDNIDVMNMTDAEFSAWRKSKARRR